MLWALPTASLSAVVTEAQGQIDLRFKSILFAADNSMSLHTRTVITALSLQSHQQAARYPQQQLLLLRPPTHHHVRQLTTRNNSSSGSSATTSPRLQQVLDGIDALNSQDPRTVNWQGKELPYELAYSQWLTDWVLQLEQQPSEELRIVARGQHVERWKTPRSSYPEVRCMLHGVFLCYSVLLCVADSQYKMPLQGMPTDPLVQTLQQRYRACS
jgi:hypothetical protein